MKLLLDLPTIKEPIYAQVFLAESYRTQCGRNFILLKKTRTPNVQNAREKDARVEREGNIVHVYMTTIRVICPGHISEPCWRQSIFPCTNLEQDWDVPHGFSVLGANNAELINNGEVK
ncbi:MAG: hypothetical protein R2784_01575 [Saprospiraceae bacterium]